MQHFAIQPNFCQILVTYAVYFSMAFKFLHKIKLIGYVLHTWRIFSCFIYFLYLVLKYWAWQQHSNLTLILLY